MTDKGRNLLFFRKKYYYYRKINYICDINRMKKRFLESPAYLSTNKHKIRQFHEFGKKTYNLK